MPQCIIRRTAYGIRANTCACVTGRQILCPGEKNLPDGFMTEIPKYVSETIVKLNFVKHVPSNPIPFFGGYIRRRLKTTLDIRYV